MKYNIRLKKMNRRGFMNVFGDFVNREFKVFDLNAEDTKTLLTDEGLNHWLEYTPYKEKKKKVNNKKAAIDEIIKEAAEAFEDISEEAQESIEAIEAAELEK